MFIFFSLWWLLCFSLGAILTGMGVICIRHARAESPDPENSLVLISGIFCTGVGLALVLLSFLPIAD